MTEQPRVCTVCGGPPEPRNDGVYYLDKYWHKACWWKEQGR